MGKLTQNQKDEIKSIFLEYNQTDYNAFFHGLCEDLSSHMHISNSQKINTNNDANHQLEIRLFRINPSLPILNERGLFAIWKCLPIKIECNGDQVK